MCLSLHLYHRNTAAIWSDGSKLFWQTTQTDTHYHYLQGHCSTSGTMTTVDDCTYSCPNMLLVHCEWLQVHTISYYCMCTASVHHAPCKKFDIWWGGDGASKMLLRWPLSILNLCNSTTWQLQPTVPSCVLTSFGIISISNWMISKRTKFCAPQMRTLFGAPFEAISRWDAQHSDIQRHWRKLGQPPTNTLTLLLPVSSLSRHQHQVHI